MIVQLGNTLRPPAIFLQRRLLLSDVAVMTVCMNNYEKNVISKSKQ